MNIVTVEDLDRIDACGAYKNINTWCDGNCYCAGCVHSDVSFYFRCKQNTSAKVTLEVFQKWQEIKKKREKILNPLELARENYEKKE